MNEQDEQSYDEGDEGSKSDDSISDHSNAVHSVLQLRRGQALQPPSDIAKGPNEAPRQPKIKFSLRSFGKGISEILIACGIDLTLGLSIPFL